MGTVPEPEKSDLKSTLPVAAMQSGKGWKPIRITSGVVGGLLVVAAILGDRFGLGDTGGFGLSQALALFLGCGMVAFAWTGKNFPGLYRGTSLLILNTLVLLILLELGAGVLLRVVNYAGSWATPPVTRAAYYAEQSWGAAYWPEFDRAYTFRYSPYELWRVAPFEGEFINVGTDGVRKTPGAECVGEAYVVDVFGGSTVWGLGVPDWGTVPAYLQELLAQALQRPVCVRNLGQLGWNSTQDLITLLRELQASRIPDHVVFLNGVNDVIPQYEHGEVGAHFSLASIAAKMGESEPSGNPTVAALSNFNLYRLGVEFLAWNRSRKAPGEVQFQGHVSDSLAASIAQVYLANYRNVEGLAREYEFASSFFWQPNLSVGRKPLTKEEEGFKIGLGVAPLMELVYARLASVGPPEYPSFHNLVNLFDEERSSVYIDWHHLTPEGNRSVAEAMVEVLAPVAKRRR